MAIVVHCSCGQSSEAPQSAAGLELDCPACGQSVTVPHPAVGPVVACQCGQRFRGEPRLIGQSVACPVCQQSIPVPHPAEQSIFDELPVGPIPVRAPTPVRPVVMPIVRAGPPPDPTVVLWALVRFVGGMLLLLFVAMQTVWICYNLFVEQLTDKMWMLRIHIPFLFVVFKFGIYLVWPRWSSPDSEE